VLAYEITETTNHWKSIIYLTFIVHILRSYVNKLKQRIKSECAALSQAVTEHSAGEMRQRLRVCLRFESRYFEQML